MVIIFRRAFTLFEAMIVVMIIAIILAAAIPNYLRSVYNPIVILSPTFASLSVNSGTKNLTCLDSSSSSLPLRVLRMTRYELCTPLNYLNSAFKKC